MSKQKATTKQQTRRGIREFTISGRKSPYAVQWREGGKRKTKTFKKESDRDKYATQLSNKTERYGTDILNFDPHEWRKWLDFKEKLGWLHWMMF